MKHLLQKTCLSFLVLPVAAWLLLTAPSVSAQTDPEGTPEEAYPPPATPAEPEESYPVDASAAGAPEAGEGYIAPTARATATTSPAAIGENAPGATVVPSPAISQSALFRNRVILWAGFLLTLLIFGLAVYGAMLMYTRPRG